MKTLLLMRHAKSSWKDSKLADHERPLNKHGQIDSTFMGEVLLEKELLPQKILASSAVRVRETVSGLLKSSSCSGETEFSDAFYLTEPDAYLTALRLQPDSFERVMIVGHNPGMEGLLQKLTGRMDSIEGGTIAYLSLPIQSWGELTDETQGDLVELLHLHAMRDEKEDTKKDKKDDKKHKDHNKLKKAAIEKIRKEHKAAEAKKHKEEKAAAEKIRKEQKASEAMKRKEEKAAEKIRKEQKAAEALLRKEEKAAAQKTQKEKKAAEAKKRKEEKEATEKIHKEQKAAEATKRRHKKADPKKNQKEEKPSPTEPQPL